MVVVDSCANNFLKVIWRHVPDCTHLQILVNFVIILYIIRFELGKCNILSMSYFRCAYLLANIQEYLTICIELMGQCILLRLLKIKSSKGKLLITFYYRVERSSHFFC